MLKAIFRHAPRRIVVQTNAAPARTQAVDKEEIAAVVNVGDKQVTIYNYAEHYTIYSAIGQLIYSGSEAEKTLFLSTGVYLIQAEEDIKKFIVQH